MQFGNLHGPSIAAAKVSGVDALKVIEIDQRIRKLKFQLRSDSSLKAIKEFEDSKEPSYPHRKAVLALL